MMRPCPSRSSSLARVSRNFWECAITSAAIIFSTAVNVFIEGCGHITTAPFPGAPISIIEIWTSRITSQTISCVLGPRTMRLIMADCVPESLLSPLQSTLGPRPPNGTHPQPASSGTGCTILPTAEAFFTDERSVSANGAAPLFSALTASVRDFARTLASQAGAAWRGLIITQEIAPGVAQRSSATNTRPKSTVHAFALALENIRATPRLISAIIAAFRSRRRMRAPFGAPIVVGEPTIVGERKVYNLSVEGVEEYFAEGILVHNCRYGAMSRPYTAPLPPSADHTEPDRYARSWRPRRPRGSAQAA